MAQATRLVIGAAAALAGGFVGGWLQSQTMGRPRQGAADDSEGSRQDLVRGEESPVLLAERRQEAYAAFGEATYSLLHLVEENRIPLRRDVESANAAMEMALTTVKIVGSEQPVALAEKITAVAHQQQQLLDVQSFRSLRDEFFLQARREFQAAEQALEGYSAVPEWIVVVFRVVQRRLRRPRLTVRTRERAPAQRVAEH